MNVYAKYFHKYIIRYAYRNICIIMQISKRIIMQNNTTNVAFCAQCFVCANIANKN